MSSSERTEHALINRKAWGRWAEALIDVRAQEDGSPSRFDHVTLDWARQWPWEEIWKVEKVS